jgi:hypothetical protein
MLKWIVVWYVVRFYIKLSWINKVYPGDYQSIIDIEGRENWL